MKDDIAAMWRSFWDAIATPGMPEIQRTEMRRAFYAGCWGMLQKARALGADEVDEDAGATKLQEWEDELRGFQRDLAAGKA